MEMLDRMDGDSDDDFFASPTHAHLQGSAADPVVQQEYARLSTRYSDAGYREGITDGKLATLQQGFDAGFALAVAPSRRLGRIRGRANALLAHLTSTCTLPSTSPDVGPLIDAVRDLVGDAAQVTRDRVLPVDEEREAHEKEEHADEPFTLDPTDERQMDDLQGALSALGAKTEAGKREEALLEELERRLHEIEHRLFG